MKLFLTDFEQHLLDQLSGDLQIEWEAEELDAYESQEQIEIRMELLTERHHLTLADALEDFQDALKEGEDIARMGILERFPNAVIPELLFSMGAVGISALVESTLPSAQSSEHLEALAELTAFRHRILEANASHVPAFS